LAAVIHPDTNYNYEESSMLRAIAIGTLMLTMMAGPRALAADNDEGLGALMDETAVALARIDVTADEPGATFASLAFGSLPAQSANLPDVFRKLLTAAGVRHVVLILQVDVRLPTNNQQFGMDAVCVIPFEKAEAAETFAKLPGLPTEREGRRVATRGRYCLIGTAGLVESALAGHPPREGIDAALAASGEAPLAVVIAPSADQRHVLASLLPTLPAEHGGDILRAWSQQAEWTTIAFVPEKSFKLIVRAKSPQSAIGLAGSLDAFLSGTVGKIRAINGRPVQLGTVLAATEQRVENDEIVLNVDLAKLPPGENIFRQVTDSALMAVNRREAMRKFKQVGILMHNHYDVHKKFPDTAIKSADGKPLLSWRVQLLPLLGQESLYKEFRLDEPWDSEHNRKLIERMPDVYRLTTGLPPGKTLVQLPVGATTAWPEGRGLAIREFTDGTSNTILAVETDDEHAVVWTQPIDLAFDPANPTAGLGSHFGEGFLTLSADGAGHFIPRDVKPDTLRALFTPAGREPVSWPGQ
jgi:hypothetical protein